MVSRNRFLALCTERRLGVFGLFEPPTFGPMSPPDSVLSFGFMQSRSILCGPWLKTNSHL